MKINLFGRGFLGNILAGRNISGGGFIFSNEQRGKQVSEERVAKPFSAIFSNGIADIEVVPARRIQTILVRGDAAAVANTVVETINDTLVVSSKAPLKDQRAVVLITMPGPLISINLNGSGDAFVHDLDQDQFTAIVQSNGDLSVFGQSRFAELILSGAGDIRCGTFKTEILKVDSRGDGDIEALATQSVSVFSNGRGDVTVRGGAKEVRKQAVGIGDIVITDINPHHI